VNVRVTVAPSRLTVIEAWSAFPLDFLGRRHAHPTAGPSATVELASLRMEVSAPPTVADGAMMLAYYARQTAYSVPEAPALLEMF
jgi:hypothetical protein